MKGKDARHEPQIPHYLNDDDAAAVGTSMRVVQMRRGKDSVPTVYDPAALSYVHETFCLGRSNAVYLTTVRHAVRAPTSTTTYP